MRICARPICGWQRWMAQTGRAPISRTLSASLPPRSKRRCATMARAGPLLPVQAAIADSEQVHVLRSGAAGWSGWRRRHPDAKPDLEGAPLRGLDLSSADLTDADLRRADLRGTVLRAARLTRARLEGANFFKAVLEGA